MAKALLKRAIKKTQNNVCEISGICLPEDTSLYDTDRINPKAAGGIYTEDNTRVVSPIAHMIRHNIWRKRLPEFQVLKECLDDREQIRKSYQMITNQLLAYKRRTDTLQESTFKWLLQQQALFGKELLIKDKNLTKMVTNLSKTDPIASATLGVNGVGAITVAYCLVYIDLYKARHASSLWSYVGLDKPSYERYKKGISGGGNKSLRNLLFTMANSQMKGRNSGSAYGYIYDRIKKRLENSERVVKSRNTEGRLIECKWKDTKPSHRHGAALRAVIKHFLADYWYVGRTLLGLPTGALYPEAILDSGHKTIMPEERGWKY